MILAFALVQENSPSILESIGCLMFEKLNDEKKSKERGIELQCPLRFCSINTVCRNVLPPETTTFYFYRFFEHIEPVKRK